MHVRITGVKKGGRGYVTKIGVLVVCVCDQRYNLYIISGGIKGCRNVVSIDVGNGEYASTCMGWTIVT